MQNADESTASHAPAIQLGLRENAAQFALLVVVNAFVARWPVGAELHAVAPSASSTWSHRRRALVHRRLRHHQGPGELRRWTPRRSIRSQTDPGRRMAGRPQMPCPDVGADLDVDPHAQTGLWVSARADVVSDGHHEKWISSGASGVDSPWASTNSRAISPWQRPLATAVAGRPRPPRDPLTVWRLSFSRLDCRRWSCGRPRLIGSGVERDCAGGRRPDAERSFLANSRSRSESLVGQPGRTCEQPQRRNGLGPVADRLRGGADVGRADRGPRCHLSRHLGHCSTRWAACPTVWAASG